MATIDVDPNTGFEACEMPVRLVAGLEAPSTDVLPNTDEELGTAGCEVVGAGGFAWLRSLDAGETDAMGPAAENRAGEGDGVARKPRLIRGDDD